MIIREAFLFLFLYFSTEEEYPNPVELVIQGMKKGLFEKGPEDILELEKWKRMERIE